MRDILFFWNKNYDCRLILEKINQIRTVSRNRVCSFDMAWYDFWLPILISSIRYAGNDHQLKKRCITATLNDAGADLLDPKNFIETCNSKFYEITKLSETDYFVYFEITYSGMRAFDTLKIDNSLLMWGPLRNKKFMRNAGRERGQILLDHENKVGNREPANLTPIIARVKAYDVRQAFEKAVDHVDTLRGLLNIIINKNRSLVQIVFSPKIHAFNKIRLGPIHSIHKLDGTLATKTLWYEPFWYHEHNIIHWKASEDELKKSLKKKWRALITHPISDHLRASVVRYCRALDQHDPSTSIIDIWGTMEFALDLQNERQETLVDRAQRIFADQRQARQVLLHLKDIRNTTAHGIRRLENQEPYPTVFQAEYMASEIIAFLFSKRTYFRKKADISSFLQIQSDPIRRSNELRLRKKYEIFAQSRRNMP